MRKLLIYLILIFAFAAFYIHENPRKNTFAADNIINEGRQRLIIKFRRFIPRALKERTVNAYGAILSEELLLPDTFIINVPKEAVSHVVRGLGKNFLVEYVEEDSLAQKLEIPNDPMYPNQWGLAKINAASAWEVARGANFVDIAIVDTGVNYTHPDLSAKIYKSVNCIFSNCPNYYTNDPDGHGTHVAGIAAAITNNSLGVAGVSWDGRILSVKVLDDLGRGYYSWIANGIVWASDNGAEIINISLGGTSASSTLKNAVDYAWGKGVILVAAAGNSSSSVPFYPAYYDNVLSVAATDQQDLKAWFSNYGLWVDVGAPGVSILSTYRSGYEYLNGTSMASPFVSGLAALIYAQNPDWNNASVRQKIENTAIPIAGTGYYWVHGRIDLCKALNCNESSFSTPTSTTGPTAVPTVISTPSPTIEPTPQPTTPTMPPASPSPTSSPTSTLLPSAATPTPIPSPTPTTKPLPWWCAYVPWHYTCQ